MGETQQKAPEAANLENWASNGLKLEPYYVEFLHLCLHDEETIEQVKAFLVWIVTKFSIFVYY